MMTEIDIHKIARDATVRGAQDEIHQLRADAGTVVHALDCALALTEAYIAFAPEGQPLSPQVITAKAALDAAMAGLHRPAPPRDEEIERLQTSLRIAAGNIASINDHNAKLTYTLQTALNLIDTCLNEVGRLPTLPMSIVVARNNFHDTMQKLLKDK